MRSLFQALSPDELDSVFAQLQTKLCLAGQRIVTQGDPGDSLFLLAEGLLNVQVATDAADRPTQIAQLNSGSFFGEMSLLTGAPRGASVVSAIDSKVFEIHRDILQPLMRGRPEIAEHMSRVLAARQGRQCPAAQRNQGRHDPRRRRA